MRLSRSVRSLIALAALILLLLVVSSAYSLPLLQPPSIPHPTEGREDCILCHSDSGGAPLPEDHEGRTKDTCLLCHQSGEAGSAPEVPHTLEGREDCLACHAAGGIKPVPADHEGRGTETCLGCHAAGGGDALAPTPTLPPSLEIVPTPIHEPELFGENSCIACHVELGGKHEEITSEWAESVHAARGVGCVSCHGGDPTQVDAAAAMSPEAGYLGPLPKERIPGLCGSCHTRVDLMRPYDLPTDQFNQYWQSFHGQALLDGDQNVATCFDCHDGHRVLKVSDPASRAYPSNEPEMCASCHADEALMEPYGIPTNQYALYEESVHGVALLQNQDLRAPTCSSCHGKHGAAPAGFTQVANVCGQCHAATEEYYLQGAHRTGMTDEAVPRCVTCHGRYDVMPATRELYVGTEDRHCGSCHAPGTEIASQVAAMHQVLTEADEAYEKAEAKIAEATGRRLIMAEQEELLQQARTPLIESRALQHTVILADTEAKAAESMEISQQVLADAEDALRDVDTRRLAMVIALAVILVTILALVLIKRELDRDLEAKRAQSRANKP